MSTVIRNDGELTRTLNFYSKNTNELQKGMLKIASGLKVNSAGDNPSDWVASERMRNQISALDQANSNVQTDTSLMRTAEGAVSNTVEIIHRLRTMAINSANDHNAEDEREVLQYSAQQLLQQINNNAATTFNGKTLLDGSQATEGLTFHIGGEANFSVTLKLEDLTVDGLGLTNFNISTRDRAVSALGVYDSSTGTYVNSITNADGSKTYGMIDTALNKALKQQSKLGAMEERMGFASDNLSVASENMTSARSTLLDADMAKEMSSYVKLNILSQATQFMLSQMNSNAMTTLDLLVPVR